MVTQQQQPTGVAISALKINTRVAFTTRAAVRLNMGCGIVCGVLSHEGVDMGVATCGVLSHEGVDMGVATCGIVCGVLSHEGVDMGRGYR